MNVSLSPTPTPKKIDLSWHDYIAGRFDVSAIPWKRCRYSGNGVIEMPTEAAKNGIIAKRLEKRLDSLVTDPERQVFRDIVGIEVIDSHREERIPDLIVIDEDTAAMIDIEKNVVITLDMPPPLLVVEVVSPSSTHEDIKVKSIEYKNRNVTDYLAVHWRRGVVFHWSRQDSSYQLTEYRDNDLLRLVSFPKLSMTVAELIR